MWNAKSTQELNPLSRVLLSPVVLRFFLFFSGIDYHHFLRIEVGSEISNCIM